MELFFHSPSPLLTFDLALINIFSDKAIIISCCMSWNGKTELQPPFPTSLLNNIQDLFHVFFIKLRGDCDDNFLVPLLYT